MGTSTRLRAVASDSAPSHCTCLGVAALLAAAPVGCSDSGPDSQTRQSADSPEPSKSSRAVHRCDRPASFADAVERVRPAVVNLFSEQTDDPAERRSERNPDGPRSPIPRRRSARSLGSGIVVESNGRVVTNHHVIDGVESVRARLADGRWFEAKLIGSDPGTDVALLELVDARELPTARLGDSADLRVGDWVVAIGNPYGLDSTVTAGIASGIGRSDLPLSGDLRYQDFIQTDASINPGNSGGPLVDTEGEVVGLNTVVREDARGIGFAIPAEMVERVLTQLERDGSVPRSWLGAYVEEVPGPLRDELDLGASGGVLVTRIVADGPADRAGLQEGDILLELDGRRVDDVDEVAWIAGNLQTGSSVDVLVRRSGEHRRLQLTPVEAPDRGNR